MADAKRDSNQITTLLAVSNADGVTPVVLWADPTTHRLLVDLPAGSGTVTSVSVVSANGFAGTVATATTTPAITLTTTITGILQGNGTAISAATTTGSGSVVLGTSPTIATPVINGTPTGTGVAAAATASTLALRDANGNLTVNQLLDGYTTTATAGGTTTLTAASTQKQFFTGVTVQTVVLPDVTTLVLGQNFMIDNNSSGNVTVQSSGLNNVVILAPNTRAVLTCILTSGTTAASWDAHYYAVAPVSGKKISLSDSMTFNTNSITFAGGEVLTLSATNAISILTTGSTSVTLPTSGTLYGTATGSITSAQLATSLSDETGSGAAVFATSPTLTTPVLGVASATSINKVAITAPATSATLTIADGKTLTANNSITLAGTDATTMTFPSVSATVAGLGTTQTFTGINTFTPAARSSGSASYLTINAPADTGISTTAESIGINHVGATRTWVDGTTATQREYLFQAPTYNKTTTSATFTKAATLAVSAAPTAGTGVTITNAYAFWAQAGMTQLDGGMTTTVAIYPNNAITATANAATVPVTSRLSTVTNNSAAALTITITTTGAVDGQLLMVRVLDFSAVAQTLAWVNTENSTVSAPVLTNGSTTLFLTAGFIYNAGTSKWRCIASA